MAKVKVILTWNIQTGKQQEYIEFAVNELQPTLGALGMQINEVWYTIAGNDPEMVVTGLMASKAEAQKLFGSYDWRQLEKRLTQFVENVNVRFRKPHAPFQM